MKGVSWLNWLSDIVLYIYRLSYTGFGVECYAVLPILVHHSGDCLSCHHQNRELPTFTNGCMPTMLGSVMLRLNYCCSLRHTEARILICLVCNIIIGNDPVYTIDIIRNVGVIFNSGMTIHKKSYISWINIIYI